MSSTCSRRFFLASVAATVAAPAFGSNCPTCRLFDGLVTEPAATASPSAKPAPTSARRQPGSGTIRWLLMYNVNMSTDGILDVVYWRNGSYDSEALRQINWFMRDWRRNSVRPISRTVIDWLYRIQDELQLTAPMGLVSGYRTPQTNQMLRQQLRGVARWSLHLEARAVDFRVHGHNVRAVARAAQQVGQRGGIGRYSRSDFVHIDDGRRRIWGA